jgi:hypothetical protein
VPFTDGAEREVYEATGGRQYVVDEATGEKVYGAWLPPADEPVIVRRLAPGPP